MVSSARQAVTCFLLIFCSALYAYSQTNPGAKGPTATISGKVTIKGKGAAGIIVGLRLVDSSGRQTRTYKAATDDQGIYKISNVPPGYYSVVAASPVFVAEDQLRPKTILVSKDETIENVDIALLRGGVITGKVTDSDGRPLVEEQVSLHPVQTSSEYYPLVGVHTDDRGIYRIYGLAPGKYAVAAGANRNFFGVRERGLYRLTYHPAATDIAQATIIEVSEGSEATNVDIVAGGRQPARYSAHGRIVDGTTGQPLANVSYGLQYFESETGGASMTSGAVSNSEGEFKFNRLAPGKYAVFIVPSHDGDWRADNVPFEVTDHDVTGLIVKTTRGASVSGVVVLEGTYDKAARANLSQVQLHAYTVGDWQSSGEPPALAPDGSFHVRALKAGMLAFSLSNHGKFDIVRIERDGISYPKGIPIKNGEQVTGVRVVLHYGSGTVRGVVKLEGDSLPQNTVTQVSLKKLGEDQYFLKSWANSALVDTRGQFSIEGVLPGTYEITASVYIPGAESALGVTKQQVAVSDGGTTNVALTVSLKPAPDRP